MTYDPPMSGQLWDALQGVRNMDLRIIGDDKAHMDDRREARERITFKRLTDEQESFAALHLALAETFFLSDGRTLTADQVRAILTRLEANGYELRRKH